MENKEVAENENFEVKITELKSQLQKSYEVFRNAHDKLGKFSFDSTLFAASSSSGNSQDFAALKPRDVKDIINAESIDDSISLFRSKTKFNSPIDKINFPNFTNFIKIMNDLQSNLESLKESQNTFSKLAEDVDEEMNVLQKRLEESLEGIKDLVVENDDGFSSDSDDDENELEGEEEEEDEDSLGTVSLSD
jgi:hypothetical protein